MRDCRVKASRQEIVKSLQGNWKKDQLFALKINLNSYESIWKQINEIDHEIENYLKQFPLKKTYESKPPSLKVNPYQKAKNNPKMKTPLEKYLWSILGSDLTRIDGLGAYSVLQIISEVGLDLQNFPTEKHFASYLGLVPRTDTSNGRIIRSKTDRIKSTVSLVFRKAVLGLSNSKTSLGAYYRRMRARIGKLQAT
jgi:transposase